MEELVGYIWGYAAAQAIYLVFIITRDKIQSYRRKKWRLKNPYRYDDITIGITQINFPHYERTDKKY